MPYHAILTGLLLATEEGGEQTVSFLSLLFWPLMLLGFFYFVFIRPNRRRQQQMQDLRASIEVGDQIRTIGGILGRVTHMEGDEAVIDVGGGTKLTITSRAIAEKLGDKEA